MLSVAEAMARITSAFAPLPDEIIPVGAAHGRVLSADVVARRDQPPVAVSAMDGYAVRAADLASGKASLRLIGEAPAGTMFEGAVATGDTVRIFTGGPLPNGADAVVMQERAHREGDVVHLDDTVAAGKFVRPAGLDFTAGQVGITAGTVLGARQLGLAVSMGHGWLNVRRRPLVALLATGDELVLPGETPAAHQIVSSNSATVAAMVRVWGGEVVDLGIAEDRTEALIERARQIAGVDLLVTSGGASVGDHDLVSSALAAEGMKLDFWKIAMRPGKPLIFGRIKGVPMLGLPGNPVSAAVCSVIYLRAALRCLLGLDPSPKLTSAVLGGPVRANDERQDHLRATCRQRPDGSLLVHPTERQDSSMFATLARAGCLILRQPHAAALDAGAIVQILRFDDAALTI